LLRQYPEIAKIDCDHCAKHSYNLSTGLPILHAGELIPRSQPPCVKDDTVCRKVRPGHSDFSEANAQIYREYQLCKSIDDWSDQHWVMSYWFHIIRDVEDSIEEQRRDVRLARMLRGR
jgi:hypothetical protein